MALKSRLYTSPYFAENFGIVNNKSWLVFKNKTLSLTSLQRFHTVRFQLLQFQLFGLTFELARLEVHLPLESDLDLTTSFDNRLL